MKRILITGGTGFIGSNVIRLLLKLNYNVGIFSRETSEFTGLKDVLDEIKVFIVNEDLDEMVEAIKLFKPDCVMHIASLFIREHKSNEVEKLIDSNIKYPSLILEAMKICNVSKFINTGTSWQHFENNDYNPVCLYAATKESFEKIIDFYVYAFNFKCITLKLFDSYGNLDNRGKLISLLKEVAETNRVIDMSKGEQKLDLTHVEDIAKGFIKAYEYLDNISSGEHKRFALCTQRWLSIKEIVDIFEESTGKVIKVNWGIRNYREREVMEPWSKYEMLPNWESTITFEEGVRSIDE